MTFLTFYYSVVIINMVLLSAGVIKDKGIKVGDFMIIFVLNAIPILNVVMVFVQIWAYVPEDFWHKTIFKRK